LVHENGHCGTRKQLLNSPSMPVQGAADCAALAEGAGFTCVNLGTNTSAPEYIAAVKEHNATILGMSALLTTTMIYMKTVITEMEAAGLGHVKICVGGAPVTQLFADEIGADGYAPDAATAVDLFKKIVSETKAIATAG